VYHAAIKIFKNNFSYEVLKDDESREEYNYMLDHPEEMWSNYYRYYRRRMAPKVDVRIVIVVTITIISGIQYYSAWSNYEEAIKYLVSVPKYRISATQIAKEDGLFNRADKKANKGKSKEQLKEEEERILRNVVEEKMDIRGGYAKPKITDILWIQLIFLPWTMCTWSYFYTRWLWKYGICKEEYGIEEKLYVIKKFMGLSNGQFDVSITNHLAAVKPHTRRN
jgi:DnaJ family protein C protein 25